MSKRSTRAVLEVAAVGVLLAAASMAWAQEALVAQLDPSGMVRLMRGDLELATIELSAHGPQWQHAPQTSATAEVTDLPDGAGKRFVGTLPVPNTNGALQFTETVKPLPQGLQLEWDISTAEVIKLNGLQVSANLAVAQYGGKELTVERPDAEPEVVGLPAEKPAQGFQIWTGQGAKIAVAPGTEDALTFELLAPTDVIVQDLRQWEHPILEVRFPAIMEDAGRDVAAEDRFHLALTVTLAAPVKLEGP